MGRSLSLALAVLSGCAVLSGAIDEDDFSDRVAPSYCKQLKRCARGFYESEYSDMDDCIDEITDDLDDMADTYDDFGCDFDEDGAQDCVDFLRTSSCEDFYEDLLTAWDWGECADSYDCG